MANEGYMIRLQDRIGYRFNNIALLERALTAPGAEGEKKGDKAERDKYKGNRKLALFGNSILQLIVLQRALFEEEAERSRAHDALKFAAFKEHHEKIARFFQIDTHMKLNPRQNGRASAGTLSLAVCAIFGACFTDSGSLSAVRTVVEHFGFGSNPEDPERYIDPITTRLQEQIVASELDSGVFGDFSDVTIGHVTLNSSPVPADNGLGVGGDISMEMHYELQRNGTQENLEYLTLSAASTPIDHRGVWTPGQEDSSIMPHCDAGNVNDETFYDNPNPGQLSHIRSENALDGQISLRDSFVELATHDRILMSPANNGFQFSINTPIGDIDDPPPDMSEEGGSSLESQMMTGELLSTERAEIATSGTKPEKRKRPASSRNKSSNIDEYILLEKARCESLGLPCPEEGFNSAITQASTKSLVLKDVMTELKVFYFAIASPESLAALKAIIKVQRQSPGTKLMVPSRDLPLAERMKEIENLNGNIAYMCFLRRCHTRQLYVDSSTGSQKSSDGFINFTTQSISTRSSSQIGNPNNLEDSRVSKLMMKEIYPELEISSHEYEKKRRFVGKLRKLGERLDLLVEKFGYGILGLLPLATDVPAVEPVLNITDSLILKIPDDTFRWFVQFLDQSQGCLLRKTSEAISEIVTAIFRGTLNPLKRFGIEELEQEEVMKHPKGSPMILDSITKTPSNETDAVNH